MSECGGRGANSHEGATAPAAPAQPPGILETPSVIPGRFGHGGLGQHRAVWCGAAIQHHLPEAADLLSRGKETGMPCNAVIEVVTVSVVHLTADDAGAPAETGAFLAGRGAFELVACFRGHTARPPGRRRPEPRAPPSHQWRVPGIERAVERQSSAGAEGCSHPDEGQ